MKEKYDDGAPHIATISEFIHQINKWFLLHTLARSTGLEIFPKALTAALFLASDAFAVMKSFLTHYTRGAKHFFLCSRFAPQKRRVGCEIDFHKANRCKYGKFCSRSPFWCSLSWRRGFSLRRRAIIASKSYEFEKFINHLQEASFLLLVMIPATQQHSIVLVLMDEARRR